MTPEEINEGPWTQFWDMHSGGGCKEYPFEKIYIQASEKDAEIIFYNKFGHAPDRVSCTCCGCDYSYREHESLEDACLDSWRPVPFNEWLSAVLDSREIEDPGGVAEYQQKHGISDPSLLITKDDISDDDRRGEVPTQGYVWM